MIGAILNTRGVFGAPAWAPVLNNIVVIVVAGAVPRDQPGAGAATTALTTGETWCSASAPRSASSRRRSSCCRRCGAPGSAGSSGSDLRGSRLGEAGPLALWVIGYVVVSQLGYLVQLRLANASRTACPA